MLDARVVFWGSVLLLAYVALRQGDAVGFQTFSGPERWLPPVKGPAGLQAILRLVYDLETTASPSDYLEAATRLDVMDRDGITVQRYRPRVEAGFARIERWTDRSTGETHWRVVTRDNVSSVFACPIS